jgi:hypothetical protein
MAQDADQPKEDANFTVLKKAIEDSTLPRIYANGFATGLGSADVVLVLQLQGRPVAIVNLSYTLTKTLAEKLGELVTKFEQAIGQDLVTTDKVDKAMKAAPSSSETTKH